MGTANLCDEKSLQPGMPCIIMVDDVNSPTGIWWGEVVETHSEKTYLRVSAKITGGRVSFYSTKYGCGEKHPLETNEEKDTEPNVNYRVYPNNETTRHFLTEREAKEEELKKAQESAIYWRKVHLQTMAYLVGRENPEKINYIITHKDQTKKEE